MKVTFCLFLLCAAASSMAYEIVTDGEHDFLLVPLHEQQGSSRAKRQTKFNFDTKSNRAQLSHTGTILNNDNHNLAGTGSISKGIPKGPLGFGGELNYNHAPSGTSLSGRAEHTRGLGTDIGATGRYNFINKPNTKVFAEGSYDRHLGGPSGNGRPIFGVGVGLQHTF